MWRADRRSRRTIAAVCLLAALCASPAAAQPRAADGVTINDQGQPQYSTFSLCAIDPATGMRRTQALRFLQTTLQIDVRRALDSPTEHQRCSRSIPGTSAPG